MIPDPLRYTWNWSSLWPSLILLAIHSLWYIVLDVLSHDLIIGLVDLIGPYYDLLADSVLSSRHLAVATDICNHLSTLTTIIATLATTKDSTDILRNARSLNDEQNSYSQRKRDICSSATSSVDLLALHDGSYIETLSHPHHGTVFANNRVESRYNLLTTKTTRTSINKMSNVLSLKFPLLTNFFETS